MWKSFPTRNQQQYPDEDELITTRVLLAESNDGIGFDVERRLSLDKSRKDQQTKQTEEVSIRGLSPKQFKELIEKLEAWVGSKTKPAIPLLEPFNNLEITYSREIPGSFGAPPNQTTREFQSLVFTVGEYNLNLHLGEGDSSVHVEIPLAELQTMGANQDYQNGLMLRDFFYEFLEVEYSGTIEGLDLEGTYAEPPSAVDEVERIFRRFGEVHHQLSERSHNRSPLKINDEYDVQYLLPALLRVHFDDIRDETYLKQHAKKRPRIDFLLEEEKIGIEVKYISEHTPFTKIRSQLAEDKEQYRSDPMVETLLCFIYDPERLENNAVEIEKDISEVTENLVTRVTVTQ